VKNNEELLLKEDPRFQNRVSTSLASDFILIQVMNRGPKSRAFYRIQATRKLTGGGNVIKKKLEKEHKKNKGN